MSIEHVFTALSLQDGLNPAVGQEFMASMKGRVEESEVSWQQNSEIGNCATFLPPTKVVSLQRQSNGFGFTLRHFVVYPPELLRRPSETGVAPVNGLDDHVDDNERQKGEPMDTVFVRQVAPSGPADKAGLSTGDQVVSVNGHPVVGRSYAQVIQLIQSSQESLELGIIPKEDCVLQMVTPAVSGPPRMTGNVQEFSQTPPPVKPKPTIRRMSNQETPGRVMSTVTINPANPYQLKLSDKASESSTGSCSDSPVASVILRRGSVDRTAMENRSFVITSGNVDYNSNVKSHSSGSLEGSGMHSPPMEGSYFVTTTDATGRPCALHFEKGSKYGNTLPLVEDGMGKNRSLSFSVVELQGFGAQRPGNENNVDTVNKNDAYRPGDIYRTENSSGGKPTNEGATHIPPFTLTAPRTTVSDGPSTTYVSTNSDVGFRQPVAIDPGYRRTRPSHEESTSHLIRTLASHMKKDRQVPLKSSTVGTTLLESQDSQHQRQQSGGGKWPTVESTSDAPQDMDFPHPAKVPKQSNEQLKHETYSSQVSMFPHKPAYEEMVLTSSFGAEVDKVGPTMPAKQGSPKPRRVSYVMATSGPGGAQKPPDQKVWGTAPPGRKPGKPTLMEGLTTVLQPSMVHVSSGMELCEDISGAEGMEMPSNERPEDEVFQCTSEEKNTDGSGIQRSNRRVSYVMATSSPTSPRHQASLNAMKEDVEEEKRDAVPGLEVCKEGLLWRKLTAVDGGKIFQRSSAKSWKLVFAVLRGHILCLYKDEASAHQEDITEEQPISIKSSIVDIAHDYTKKKNVFRMTTFNGSGYLFQAEDHDSMMSWISAIQANNNPDEDDNGVSSQSLIIRRMKTVEQETSGSNSSSPSHKLTPPSTTKMPSLPGISNIKKGISFRSITTGQKGESGKNHGHKANKKRKKPSAATTTYPPGNCIAGHSVGVPLEMCPPSKKNKFVPLIVEHCCDVVERKGLESVGVYRVPGNSAAVTALVEELNTRGIENVCLEEDKWNDVNNITSLFKQFLRKLPEGLVTADLYDGFIEANKKEDSVDRMWALRSMVQELPDHNFETLKLLALHLKLVSENCDKNKMEVRNLAIVFGPTLVRTGDDSMMSLVKDMSDQCRIVETLISECEWFFEDSDGDECPIKAPPVCQESVQEDILSHNVLTSLGQVAINFGEDGAYKQKGSGISLHMPKFRSSKTTKSDSGQGSSSDGLMSDSQGSEGSPPMERAPVVRNVSGDGSRSNSPTTERRIVGKRPSDSLQSVQIVIEPSDGDFKPKVAGSLKAYSYAHPPPPSYRRTSQRRAASPSPAETPLAPLEATFIPSSDGDIKKSSEESSYDPDSIPKPSFASFSEETRLRLLKMNLQQKAAEKRRQNEIEKQVTPPPVDKMEENIARDTSLDVPRDPSRDMSRECSRELPRRASDQESLENVEQLSSSSNSRSSSTPSSKNPSLDSLHVIHQPDKVTGSSVFGSSEAPRVNSAHQLASQPNARSEDMKPRSYETVVAVIQGRGVVAGTARQLEAALRPASSDIRARRESVEERRLARRSFGSESSDTSSDDDDESALNMNKTFNEKLRMLLDLENTFATEKRGSEGDLQSYNGSEAFVSSESHKRRVAAEDNSPILSYEEPSVRTYPGVGKKSFSNSETSVSPNVPSDPRVTISLAHGESPGLESNSKMIRATNSADFRLSASEEELSCSGQTSSTGIQMQVEESPESSKTRKVGLLRQKFEGGQVRSPRSSVSEDIQPSTKGSPERRKIGSVHTTTPVSLKEFTVKPASVKRTLAQGVSSGHGMPRGVAASKNRDLEESPRRVNTLASKNIRLESSPAKHSSTLPSQRGSPKSEGGNVRSGISINLASSGRSKAQPPVNKTHVPPRVMSWETGNKSKVLSHKDSAKELLPSKTTIPTSRDIKSSQTRRKLEKDAQHIADLLQEMHSERDLRISRQQSDISGQAQKAAAQRAAMRRRRRSLGDGNDSGAVQHPPTSPTERNRNTTVYKTTGPRKGSASHWPSDLEERKRLPNRGNALRTGAHSATR